MSDRIIRDELLTSERYWAVSNEAKLLYIHLILNADDTARFSGKNFTLRTACFPSQAMQPEHMERLLNELQEQDLIRLYMVEGERFVFIPRFKQRLRFINSKFPPPPNEINDLMIKKSDSSQTKDVPKTDSSQQKRREVKRREEKSIAPPDGVLDSGDEAQSDKPTKKTTACKPDDVSDEVWDGWLSHRRTKKATVSELVMKQHREEANLAGLSLDQALTFAISKGWVAFNANYYRNAVGSNGKNNLSKDIFEGAV